MVNIKHIRPPSRSVGNAGTIVDDAIALQTRGGCASSNFAQGGNSYTINSKLPPLSNTPVVDGLDAANRAAYNSLRNGGNVSDATGAARQSLTENPYNRATPTPVQPRQGFSPMGVVDTGVSVLGTASGLIGMTAMVPFAGGIAAGGVNGAAKLTKSTRLTNFGAKMTGGLEKLNSFSNADLVGKFSKSHGAKLASTKAGQMGAFHTATHAAWIAGSGVGMYGAARDFSSQLESIKQMEADLTGKPAQSISTSTVLFGSVSKPVAEARKHVLITDGTHMAAHLAGLVVNIKSMKSPNAFGGMVTSMLAYALPDQISSAVDTFAGESVASIYKPMADAQKAGEVLPPEAYKTFLVTASKDLQSRGSTGSRFAEALAVQYAAEKMSVADVLKEVHGGGMQARVDAIAAAEKQAQPVSHVERLNKTAALTQPVIGAHTKQVTDRAAVAPLGTTLH